MKTNRQIIREYYFSTCLPRHHSHDYPSDEKLLQEIFSDKKLRLRYSIESNTAQVWYEDRCGSLRCVYNIEPPYNIHRAIAYLRQQQRTARQLRAQWEQYQLANKAKTDYKISQLAEETHRQGDNYLSGKETDSRCL